MTDTRRHSCHNLIQTDNDFRYDVQVIKEVYEKSNITYADYILGTSFNTALHINKKLSIGVACQPGFYLFHPYGRWHYEKLFTAEIVLRLRMLKGK